MFKRNKHDEDTDRNQTESELDPTDADRIEDVGVDEDRKTKRVSHKRRGWSDRRIKSGVSVLGA